MRFVVTSTELCNRLQSIGRVINAKSATGREELLDYIAQINASLKE